PAKGRTEPGRPYNRDQRKKYGNDAEPGRPYNRDQRKTYGNDAESGRPFNRDKRKTYGNDTESGHPYSRDKRTYDQRSSAAAQPGYERRRGPSRKPFRQEPEDDGLIRLNRYIANAGICSRRKADELIEAGVIRVNGEVVTALGTKVDPAKDDIRYNGERLQREKMVYVLLNKPK